MIPPPAAPLRPLRGPLLRSPTAVAGLPPREVK